MIISHHSVMESAGSSQWVIRQMQHPWVSRSEGDTAAHQVPCIGRSIAQQQGESPRVAVLYGIRTGCISADCSAYYPGYVGPAAAVLRSQKTHGSTRGGISSSVMMTACCMGRWLLRGARTPERVVQECKGLVQPGQHQPHEPPWLHSHEDLYQSLRQPPLQTVQEAIWCCEGD